MNCKQYQDDLAARAVNDCAARRTTNLLRVSWTCYHLDQPVWHVLQSTTGAGPDVLMELLCCSSLYKAQWLEKNNYKFVVWLLKLKRSVLYNAAFSFFFRLSVLCHTYLLSLRLLCSRARPCTAPSVASLCRRGMDVTGSAAPSVTQRSAGLPEDLAGGQR